MTLWAMGLFAVAIFITGGVIDFMSLINQKHQLQGIADRAAIAAAQELAVFKGADERVAAVATSFVNSNYAGKTSNTSARIIDDGKAVEVEVIAKAQTYFAGPVARGVTEVKVQAVADISGGGYVCMIGLSETEPATLDMHDNARVTAENCAIYSNSRSKTSLNLHDLARVKADLVCVAGGVSGALSAVSPNKPIEDCAPMQDPLRDRPMPKLGLLKCDHLKTVAVTKLSGTMKLKPGVYCGGINVVGGKVELAPGVYILNNGALTVTAGGSLVGENVGFFLTGKLGVSTIHFAASSTISLTAPKTGDMAGLLFYEDRDILFKVPHRISSNNARNLVGTFYLPSNTLTLDSKHPVADQSDFTVIIARKFDMRDGPELILNTDYENSPIPVPDGVGNNVRPIVKLAASNR